MKKQAQASALDRHGGRTRMVFSWVSFLGHFSFTPHTPYRATAAAPGATPDLEQLQRLTSSCIYADIFLSCPAVLWSLGKGWVQSVCNSHIPLSQLTYSVLAFLSTQFQTKWPFLEDRGGDISWFFSVQWQPAVSFYPQKSLPFS